MGEREEKEGGLIQSKGQRGIKEREEIEERVRETHTQRERVTKEWGRGDRVGSEQGW